MTNRAAWLVVLLVLLLIAAPYARAQATSVHPLGGMSTAYGGGTVAMNDGSDFSRLLQREYTPRSTSGSSTGGGWGSRILTNVNERYGITAGGSAIEVTAARTITAEAMARAAIAVGAVYWAANVGFNAGAPISKALGNGEFTVGGTRCTATNTGWQCDDGQDATPQTNTFFRCTISGSPTGSGSTPSSACADWAAQSTGVQFGELHTYSITGCTGQLCSWEDRVNGQVVNQGSVGATEVTETANTCPASTDALNPNWSVPAGRPADPDGKCPTGRYTGASDSKVLDRMRYGGLAGATAPTIGTELLPKIWEGGQPVEATGPRDLSGPSSAPKPGPGTTTTTTNPDGTTTTTTTPPGTNNYTYNTNVITINNSTTTTTTNNGGTTTTTTNEDKDPCADNPDRAGCVKLGDPGTDKPVWQTKDIPFNNENLGLGGACPAPWTTVWHGWSLSMSYQPLCDIAPLIRAALLALVGLGTLMFCIRETQS